MSPVQAFTFPFRAGMSEGVLFQPDASKLRQGRKFLALGLQPHALKTYQPMLRKHVVAFLTRLLTKPDSFCSAVSMYVEFCILPTNRVLPQVDFRLPTGIALEITYGHQITGEDDGFLQRAQISVERFSSAVVVSLKEGFVVNWIPICMPRSFWPYAHTK